MRPDMKGRQTLLCVVEVVDSQTLLFETVCTRQSTGCFASGLNSRQQKGDQKTYNRNHHKKFDKRKRRKFCRFFEVI
jgi:hypothetical protein